MIKICRSILNIKAKIRMEKQIFGEVSQMDFSEDIFSCARLLADEGHNIIAVREGGGKV